MDVTRDVPLRYQDAPIRSRSHKMTSVTDTPTGNALRWRLIAVLWVGYIGAATFLLTRNSPIVCPFRRLTGIRCPLCGLTTSVGLALRGRLMAAHREHVFGLPVLLGGAVVLTTFRVKEMR